MRIIKKLDVKNIINEIYPNKGESKKDFISRFMSVTKDEYPDIKQRYAVANSYWNRRDLKESQSNISEFIINPEDNIELAKEISSLIKDNITPKEFKLVRDNCLPINRNLNNDLIKAGYNSKLINGYFIVDNLNLLDKQDLKYLNKLNDWKQSNLSIKDYVEKNNLLGKDLGWYTYIPHWWIKLDNLIIDKALPMFYSALEKPVGKDNYTLRDYNESLCESTRNQLISKSKSADKYADGSGSRWNRKNVCKIANTVKDYNKLNMDLFWKKDILQFGIRVQGETNTYIVDIEFSNVLPKIQRNIERDKNKLEINCIYDALFSALNSSDVKINCSCPDYRYRLRYFNSKNGDQTGDKETRASNITNPNDTKGPACKHILAALNNAEWLRKIASVINNYINYCKDNMQYNYSKYIFPKLYGIPYEKAVQMTLNDYDSEGKVKSDLDSDEALLNLSNALGKVRGQFKKGSNVNTASKKTAQK